MQVSASQQSSAMQTFVSRPSALGVYMTGQMRRSKASCSCRSDPIQFCSPSQPVWVLQQPSAAAQVTALHSLRDYISPIDKL